MTILQNPVTASNILNVTRIILCAHDLLHSHLTHFILFNLILFWWYLTVYVPPEAGEGGGGLVGKYMYMNIGHS